MPRKRVTTYDATKDVFAARLTGIMDRRGITQAKLADMVRGRGGVMQRQTISQYMNGQSRPDTERLTMLCQALGVSADFLLGLSDAEQQDADVQVASAVTGLNGESIKMLKLIDTDGLNEFLTCGDEARGGAGALVFFGECVNNIVAEQDNVAELIRKYTETGYMPRFKEANQARNNLEYAFLKACDYVRLVLGVDMGVYQMLDDLRPYVMEGLSADLTARGEG